MPILEDAVKHLIDLLKTDQISEAEIKESIEPIRHLNDQQLIDNGKNDDSSTIKLKLSPLHEVISMPEHDPAHPTDRKRLLLTLLLKNGFKTNIICNEMFPLHLACQQDNLEAVKLLLGAEQARSSLINESILHERRGKKVVLLTCVGICCKYGSINCLEWLSDNSNKFQINFNGVNGEGGESALDYTLGKYNSIPIQENEEDGKRDEKVDEDDDSSNQLLKSLSSQQLNEGAIKAKLMELLSNSKQQPRSSKTKPIDTGNGRSSQINLVSLRYVSGHSSGSRISIQDIDAVTTQTNMDTVQDQPLFKKMNTYQKR